MAELTLRVGEAPPGGLDFLHTSPPPDYYYYEGGGEEQYEEERQSSSILQSTLVDIDPLYLNDDVNPFQMNLAEGSSVYEVPEEEEEEEEDNKKERTRRQGVSFKRRRPVKLLKPKGRRKILRPKVRGSESVRRKAARRRPPFSPSGPPKRKLGGRIMRGDLAQNKDGKEEGKRLPSHLLLTSIATMPWDKIMSKKKDDSSIILVPTTPIKATLLENKNSKTHQTRKTLQQGGRRRISGKMRPNNNSYGKQGRPRARVRTDSDYHLVDRIKNEEIRSQYEDSYDGDYEVDYNYDDNGRFRPSKLESTSRRPSRSDFNSKLSRKDSIVESANRPLSSSDGDKTVIDKEKLKTFVNELSGFLSKKQREFSGESTTIENRKNSSASSYHYQSYSAPSPYLVASDSVPANEKYQPGKSPSNSNQTLRPKPISGMQETFRQDIVDKFNEDRKPYTSGNKNKDKTYVEFTEDDAVPPHNKPPVYYMQPDTNQYGEFFASSNTQYNTIMRSKDANNKDKINPKSSIEVDYSKLRLNEDGSELTSFETNERNSDEYSQQPNPYELPDDLIDSSFQAEDENESSNKVNLFELKQRSKSQTPVTYIRYTSPTRKPSSGKQLSGPFNSEEKSHNPFFKDMGPFPTFDIQDTGTDLKISDSRHRPIFVTPASRSHRYETVGRTEKPKEFESKPSFGHGVYFIPKNSQEQTRNLNKVIEKPPAESPSNYISTLSSFRAVSNYGAKIDRSDDHSHENMEISSDEQSKDQPEMPVYKIYNGHQLEFPDSRNSPESRQAPEPRIFYDTDIIFNKNMTKISDSILRGKNKPSSTSPKPQKTEENKGVFMDVLTNYIQDNITDNETLRNSLTLSVVENNAGGSRFSTDLSANESHTVLANDPPPIGQPTSAAFSTMFQVGIILGVLVVAAVLLFHYHHFRRECFSSEEKRRRFKQLKKRYRDGSRDVDTIDLKENCRKGSKGEEEKGKEKGEDQQHVIDVNL